MKQLLLLLIAMLSLSGTLHAQKKYRLIESKDEILLQATRELDSAMQAPNGKLYRFCQKNNIKGEYTMQLSLRNKGSVVSVYVADKKNADIPSQNKLKDELLKFRFGFKMPKNKDYKLSYYFNL